tara:strand:- start:11206 stop:12030 length:825 start_codon:yes stop_codon:yes gene_type:complete
MNIYDNLKDVLSPEQLNEFKTQVSKLVDDSVAEKVLAEQVRLEEKAEEYVSLMIAEKTEELEEKAEEFCEMQISEATQELIEEYDIKMEDFESTVVESLDRFLDSEISEGISDELVESIAEYEALMPIVEGIKGLFENNYVALDTEGSSKLAKIQEEKEELEEQLSESIAQKMELAQLAEKAATELLIKEKSDELTISESEKVATFFSDKSFDDVSDKIDGYIRLISEEDSSTVDNGELMSEASADADCQAETQPMVESHTPEFDLIKAASLYC